MVNDNRKRKLSEKFKKKPNGTVLGSHEEINYLNPEILVLYSPSNISWLH